MIYDLEARCYEQTTKNKNSHFLNLKTHTNFKCLCTNIFKDFNATFFCDVSF